MTSVASESELLELPLLTVEDARNFFIALDDLRARGKPLPPIHHLFFAKVDDGLLFQPYHLRAVSQGKRPNNYYIVTKSHVIRADRMTSQYEVVSTVEEWMKEAEHFERIRALPFFQHFIKRKALLRWCDSVRRTRMRRNRQLVSKQLLLCNSVFRKDTASLGKCFSQLQWKSSASGSGSGNTRKAAEPVYTFAVTSDNAKGEGYSEDQFSTLQDQHTKRLKSAMAEVLVSAVTALVTRAESTEDAFLALPNCEERVTAVGSVNKEIEAKAHRDRQRAHKKALVAVGQLGSLVRLSHQMQIEASFHQIYGTLFHLRKVVMNREPPRSSAWLFRLECAVVNDTLSVTPTRESVVQLSQSTLDNALNLLSSIPTGASSTELQKNVAPVRVIPASTLLYDDSVIALHIRAVIQKIAEDYDEAMKKLSVYEPLLTASRLIGTWTELEGQWTVSLESDDCNFREFNESDIRSFVSKATKLLQEVKLLGSRAVGTVLISCNHSISSVSHKLEGITRQAQAVLHKLTDSLTAVLKDELHTWKDRLRSPELELEPFIRWFLEVQEAEEQFEEFSSKSTILQNFLRLEAELNEKMEGSGGRSAANDSATTLREGYGDMVTTAKEFYGSNATAMKANIRAEHERILKSLEETVASVEGSFVSQSANEGEPALKKLAKIQDGLHRQRQESRRLDKYGEVLGMESLNWSEIGVTEDEVKKYVELWKTHDEMEELALKLETVPVERLDGQELKDTIITLFQRAFKSSKTTPGSAAEFLVDYLGQEKSKVTIYMELCNRALKEEHWAEVFRTTGTDPIPMNTRTLKELEKSGLLEGHEEAITAVVSNAVGVFELEERLSKIDAYWVDRVFRVAPYAGRPNCFVVDGADEILEELEEQQVVIQTCLASKFVSKVQKAVEEWDAKLSMIRAVILEWISVQKAWMYLEFIFSSDDIKRQLPDESLLFSSADRFFSSLMKRCFDDPHVAPLCLEGGDALKKLEKCMFQLDCIQKKLDEYLETKRVAFPRFYFLSNDELLSILSDSRNPLAVQPHLQKCFDNIKELVFADTKTIVSMKSSEGEEVKFSKEVKVFGNVESWLNDVERAMRETLYDALAASVAAYSHEMRNTWIFAHPAQCVATTDQIVWTGDVERVITDVATSASAWQDYNTWFQQQLLGTVDLVKQNLPPLHRTVVSNLIVVDVHCRDVCTQLTANGCSSVLDFDWQKQLRYYWTEPTPDSTVKDCVIRHGAAQLSYGYEYLGNQPRLVITPLTERAFLTCTAALHMQKGAAPQGPAGTGKTESVKDLGKALARQVVVFNCSDGLNYKMMSQMFAGLAQGGAWACFDEFNRIELEVLSVVAQQMLDITTAIANRQTSMLFEGHRIKLHPNFGVFITMNPGYAGRTELPDNLKALFRPICMMIPNYALIAEIMFYSEGYVHAGVLAQKMIRLYSLASQQLSKQDHYDFGMRAVKSILVLAGRLKRAAPPDTDEELLLVTVIRDANLPKFLTHDTHLFLALIEDFFPRVAATAAAGTAVGSVKDVIRAEAGRLLQKHTALPLQPTDGMLGKTEQLFDTLTTRHGLMLVGRTMTGKSTVLHTLASTLTNLGKLRDSGDPGEAAMTIRADTRYGSYFTSTSTVTCNPKSITMTELYGDVNPLTREWQDGIFSSTVRELVREVAAAASSPVPPRHWIVFDGPVDAIWIENLNTVLDDSKILCLVNGERIRVPDTISLLFEVQDLRVASPATVSRCGMVYVDEETLEDGWTPQLRSLSQAAAKEIGSRWKHHRFMELCSTVVAPLLSYVRAECKEYIPSVNAQLARNLFYVMKAGVVRLLSVLADAGEGDNASSPGADGGSVNHNHATAADSDTASMIAAARRRASRRASSVTARATVLLLGDSLFDALFVQSCVWGVGGNLADASRESFAAHLLQLVRQQSLYFPEDAEEAGHGVYDYCVDAEIADWRLWSDLVPGFRYDASLSFFDLVVPTEHSVILNYLLQTAVSVQQHILLNGVTGTAKSSTVHNFLLTHLKTEHASSRYSAFSYTLSAQTSSQTLQETLEAKLTKRKGDKELGPAHDKALMVAVIDDCNMPQLEEYGAAPPIELLRQMLTQGGFYDRKKLFFKSVVQTLVMACCGEPGGGKNPLCPRFTAKMLTFCVPQLSTAQMTTIYGAILRGFLEARNFAADVVDLAEAAVESTLTAYHRIAVECLPTPEKTHCTFNLRDVSKVIQGMLQVKPAHCATRESFAYLWSHEAARVFHDRLIDDRDRGWWWRCAQEIVQEKLLPGTTVSTETLRDVMYGIWGSQTHRDYQRIETGPHMRAMMDQYLAEYNQQSATPMDLVLFTEAAEHLSRICRVISQPRGHALLVGVGGSGRTSLCRLAASMMNMDMQTVTVVRGYSMEHFRDEMRKALLDSGARGKDVVFVLSDPQLVFSQMLEDVNNVLNTGEVPGMMRLEDMEVVLRFCREPCMELGRPDSRSSVYQYFVDRCRERLHVVLCMSPMSGCFRERLRMFPALVNCTTIDWFSPWPQEALLAVASSVLRGGKQQQQQQQEEKEQEALAALMVHIHHSVTQASHRLYEEQHRRTHTTPTSYLAALALYQSTLRELTQHITDNAQRYRNGLQKLDGANDTIKVLKQQISDMQPALAAAAKEAAAQQQSVREEQAEADVLKEAQSKEEASALALMQDAEGIRRECEEGLQEAMPALQAAERALETLSAKDIQEIKTFSTPPSNVEKTMNAVLILLKEKEGWPSAKACLGKMDFISRLTSYPRDEIVPGVIRKLSMYINDPEFVPEVIEKTSVPCRSMCMWAHAMYRYYFVAKEIEPKRERLRVAEGKAEAARADLQAKQAALRRILDKITALEAAAKAAQERVDQLNRQMDLATARLHRADQLTSGLAAERVRWESSLVALDEQRTRVVGTAALGAGCVAYLGPFPIDFREELIAGWKARCEALGLTYDDDFALEHMMPEAVVQQWALQSLPRDTFSVQNATILQRSARWCYMIDPQGQANTFIRKKESGAGGHGLLVLKLSDDNFMRSIENAVQVGQPVLLEGVGETLDAALDPILLKQVRRVSGRNVVVLGDKEVTYDDRFKLFITTKLPNPVLTPELQVKLTVLHFAVTREGLEEQLLADIVGTERAALQLSRDRCIVSIAANREEIRALEEEVLRMLNDATGEVLDNVDLIQALQTSKATAEKIAKELALSEETNRTIDLAREKYRPLATRGSLLFTVVADLARVDPMYEYSLQFFKELVVSVLENTSGRGRAKAHRSSSGAVTGLDGSGEPLAGAKGGARKVSSSVSTTVSEDTLRALEAQRRRSSVLSFQQSQMLLTTSAEDIAVESAENGQSDAEVEARVTMLTEELTWTTYRVLCRGLFEEHKLLFSFLLATTVMRHNVAQAATAAVNDSIPAEEWEIFLRGGVGRRLPAAFADDRRPDFLHSVAWTDLGALCTLHAFQPLQEHFFASQAVWRRWCTETNGDAILAELPPPAQALTAWRCVMLMKAIRPERLHAMALKLVQSFLGDRYTHPPAFQLREAFFDSTKLSPIIFVLSPGTDPTELFCTFAQEMGFAERRYMLSLGQDQGPRAEKMIDDGRRDGSWVYLQNCHVYASWMPRLQQLVEAITPNDTHDDFRLWLTSSPSPSFPAAVLQAGMKLTREPPLGLKGKVRDTLSLAAVAERWDGNTASGDGVKESSISALSHGESSAAHDGSTAPSGHHTASSASPLWRRLVVALALFHGVIMERRQFCPLGWNQIYAWGAADFAAGLCTLTTALSRYSTSHTSEEAAAANPAVSATGAEGGAAVDIAQQRLSEELAFMLGTIDYGGRVTDMWDTRCLEVIARRFFSVRTIAGDADQPATSSAASHAPVELGQLPALPDGCTYAELIEWVEGSIPDKAPPEVYGLHHNASTAVDRKRSLDMVQALVSIHTGGGEESPAGGGTSASAKTGNDAEGAGAAEEEEEEMDGPVLLMAKVLMERLPPRLPPVGSRPHKQVDQEDPNNDEAGADAAARAAAAAPLHTLLTHEVDRYNGLLDEMHRSLRELIRALKGEVVMTTPTEQMAARLGFNQVPDGWLKRGYLSRKPLGAYFDDFLRRIAFIDQWRRTGPPPSFWLPGLFFPQGFITAVLQSRSRALRVPIDSLRYRFRALTPTEGAHVLNDSTPTTKADVVVGAYVHGLFLEGCGWDEGRGGLTESRPGVLTVELPVLHFEPVDNDAPEHYDVTYDCPLYMVSTRAGTLSTTGVSTNYIVTLILPSLDAVAGEHWTLRGVAALCSLDV